MSQDCSPNGSLINPLSRREFLKFGSASFLGFLIPPLQNNLTTSFEHQGRVIESKVSLYSEPSFQSKVVRHYWKDMVLSIREVTLGDQEPAHNRVWYRIGDEGYVHSGVIQPVETIVNQPSESIPPEGNLAEVTVPYTDAHRGPGKNFPVAYRYYYETTHWILGMVRDAEGMAWYHVLEDKWDNEYYAPAAHMRLIPPQELDPISPHVPPQGKRIEVLTTEQVVIAFEWDRPVFIVKTSTGAKFSNGDFSTPSGRHLTFHKRPSRHMAAGNLAFNGYDLPGVPWITYFTQSGISFHGTYWHNNFGRQRSHGCVNLTSKAAKWLYLWTVPVVPAHVQDVYENFGTPVDVIA